jgi:hypothetical protein
VVKRLTLGRTNRKTSASIERFWGRGKNFYRPGAVGFNAFGALPNSNGPTTEFRREQRAITDTEIATEHGGTACD